MYNLIYIFLLVGLLTCPKNNDDYPDSGLSFLVYQPPKQKKKQVYPCLDQPRVVPRGYKMGGRSVVGGKL